MPPGGKQVKNKNRMIPVTILVIAGVLLIYINEMAVSPVLSQVRSNYGIGNEALLNLSSTIKYPPIILFSLLGASSRRLRTGHLFTLSMLLYTAGMVLCLFASSYWVLLAARALYGAGYGFEIPFIGNAIAEWYDGRARERMNTLNGLFPLIGSMICFACMVPLYHLLSDNLRYTFAVFALPGIAVLVFWFCFGQNESRNGKTASATEVRGKGYQKEVLKNRNILLLCLAFVCDFFCCSHIFTVVPDILDRAFSTGAEMAGIISAFLLPAVGVVGGIVGGRMSTKFGLRRPPMLTGQVLKFVGMILMTAGLWFGFPFMIAGTALFGLGNSIWMPAMYMSATENVEADPAKTGFAFSFILSSGFVAGFLSPIIGGALTDLFMKNGMPFANASGVCILLFSIANLISYFLIRFVRETGPGKERSRQ